MRDFFRCNPKTKGTVRFSWKTGSGFDVDVAFEAPKFDKYDSKKNDALEVSFSKNIIFLVVVLNIFYFHPYLGKIPNLTNIFHMG